MDKLAQNSLKAVSPIDPFKPIGFLRTDPWVKLKEKLRLNCY